MNPRILLRTVAVSDKFTDIHKFNLKVYEFNLQIDKTLGE